MEKIREELTALFDKMMTQLNGFRKKSYEGIFKDAFQEYKGVISDMAKMLEEASEDERQALTEELASVIPDYAYEKMQAEPKSKRERKSVDYNMTMAVYIIPMIGYTRNADCEAVGKRMVELWNEKKITSLELSYATFEDITSGFKKGFCFITTAVCESKNKPDDCYELTTLRTYRDEYMMQTEDGRKLVEEYYDIAPGIVQVLDMQSKAEDIYEHIYQDYLTPCIHLIEEGQNEACRDLYKEMVRGLQKKYLHS